MKDSTYYYRERIQELEKENAELRRKYGEAVGLAASLATTSDSMKLQLILSGALNLPGSVKENLNEG